MSVLNPLSVRTNLLNHILKTYLGTDDQAGQNIDFVSLSLRQGALLGITRSERVVDTTATSSQRGAAVKEHERVVSKIGSRITDSGTGLAYSRNVQARRAAVVLLRAFIQHAGEDVFRSQQTAILSALVHLAHDSNTTTTRSSALEGLGEYFKIGRQLASVKRAVSEETSRKPAMSCILAAVHAPKEQVVLSALTALQDVLQAFGTLPPLMGTKIETACINAIILSPSIAVQQQGAYTLAALPICVEGGARWSAICLRSLATVHSLLGTLFLGLEFSNEIPTISYEKPYTLPPTPAASTASGLLSRVRGLVNIVTALLSQTYAAPVSVPAQHILDLVTRLTAIESDRQRQAKAKRPPFPAQDVVLVLPELHSIGFQLLSAVVTATRRALLPHAPDLSSLLIRVRERAVKNSQGSGDPYARASVHTSLYQACATCIQHLGLGVYDSIVTRLLPLVYADIQPSLLLGSGVSTGESQARESKGGDKSMKRRRLIGYTADLGSVTAQGSDQVTLKQTLVVDAVSIAALQMLSAAYSRCGHYFPRMDLLQACEHLLHWLQLTQRALVDMYDQSTGEPRRDRDLARFRLHVVRALTAAVISGGLTLGSAVTSALALLAKGRDDPCAEVARECSVAHAAITALTYQSTPMQVVYVSLTEGGEGEAEREGGTQSSGKRARTQYEQGNKGAFAPTQLPSLPAVLPPVAPVPAAPVATSVAPPVTSGDAASAIIPPPAAAPSTSNSNNKSIPTSSSILGPSTTTPAPSAPTTVIRPVIPAPAASVPKSTSTAPADNGNDSDSDSDIVIPDAGPDSGDEDLI